MKKIIVMFCRAMAELNTNVRVKAEGLGIIVKSVLSVAILVFDERRLGGRGDLALLAFAVGQLMYAVCVLSTYFRHYGMVLFWLTKINESRK
jgi:oligosaccharide translocation protein RFT1